MVSIKKKKRVRLPDEPMNLDQFLSWLQEPPIQRHKQIIAEWAKANGVDYETVDQWNAFIKKNLRAAALIAPFPDDKIEKAMHELYEADYIQKPTLWTLTKFLIK